MKTLIPKLLFIVICLCGLFLAWIDGVQPLTEQAQFVTSLLIFCAFLLSTIGALVE